MIRFQVPSGVVHHTEQYADLREFERNAGRELANSGADIGLALIRIEAELEASGTMTFAEWIEHQAAHDRARAFKPIDERRVREYVAAANFRKTYPAIFHQFIELEMSLCCVMPVLSLTEEQIRQLMDDGVKAPDGTVKPIKEASRDEIRAAVATIKGKPKPAPTPKTREQRIAAVKRQLDALGELTDEERKTLGLAAQTPDARTQTTDGGAALARRSLGVPTLPGGAAAPDEGGAAAEGTAKAGAPAAQTPDDGPQTTDTPAATDVAPPFQTYQGRLGPVTLTGGRLVLGTLERTALADQTIAAIRETTQKAMLVNSGSGKLAAGRKTTAKAALEELRLALLKWPAMT